MINPFDVISLPLFKKRKTAVAFTDTTSCDTSAFVLFSSVNFGVTIMSEHAG